MTTAAAARMPASASRAMARPPREGRTASTSRISMATPDRISSGRIGAKTRSGVSIGTSVPPGGPDHVGGRGLHGDQPDMPVGGRLDPIEERLREHPDGHDCHEDRNHVRILPARQVWRGLELRGQVAVHGTLVGPQEVDRRQDHPGGRRASPPRRARSRVCVRSYSIPTIRNRAPVDSPWFTIWMTPPDMPCSVPAKIPSTTNPRCDTLEYATSRLMSVWIRATTAP